LDLPRTLTGKKNPKPQNPVAAGTRLGVRRFPSSPSPVSPYREAPRGNLCRRLHTGDCVKRFFIEELIYLGHEEDRAFWRRSR
jgi:hypothetical protein